VLRVLHFSDVHVQEPVLSGPVQGLLGKRLLAGVNLWLVRGRQFEDAPQKLAALVRFAEAHGVDAALCTGDYTALGTVAEHRRARAAIAPFTHLPGGYCTVPGNHDLYLPDTLRDGRFDAAFADCLASDLPELCADGAYPFVRLIGDTLAVVGINSARPNPNPFLSSGLVPDAQLAALDVALGHPALGGRRRMVMTHYGVLRADGRPDAPRHGLDNAAALVGICARHNAILVHGHIHHTFHHVATAAMPTLFCAGSATMRGREGFWLYELAPGLLRARQGYYRDGEYALREDATVELR
jgi:hypothetical protein